MSIAGQQTAGFHVKGESSKGKSTMLYAACSIYGKPLEYRRTWNSTEVGAGEYAVRACNDMFLALDEIAPVVNRKMPTGLSTCYHKVKAATGGRDNGGNRALLSWTCCLFSTGEG